MQPITSVERRTRFSDLQGKEGFIAVEFKNGKEAPSLSIRVKKADGQCEVCRFDEGQLARLQKTGFTLLDEKARFVDVEMARKDGHEGVWVVDVHYDGKHGDSFESGFDFTANFGNAIIDKVSMQHRVMTPDVLRELARKAAQQATNSSHTR